MDEEWRRIPSCPSYEASNLGRIRHGQTPIRACKTSRGYLRFNVYQNGRRIKTVFVHGAVLEAFIGKRPMGMQTRHLNGVRDDNRLDNLRYGSHRENQIDKHNHGNVVHGERHGRAKISSLDASEILRLYCLVGPNRSNARELANRYGISKSMVQKIVKGLYWKDALAALDRPDRNEKEK